MIRKLRAEGMGIIFVTHFIDQVYAISDRITVLRDGGLVGEYETAKLPKVELVSRMIGKNLTQLESVRRTSERVRVEGEREPFIELRKLGRAGSVAPMDMNIGKGEIVGLAGLLGSGRTETARLLFGIGKPKPVNFWWRERKSVLSLSASGDSQAVRVYTRESQGRRNCSPSVGARKYHSRSQGPTGDANTLSRKRQEEIAESGF